MVFSSLRFFLFLAAMLGLLALPLGHRTKKVLLCVGSCLFYAAWDYRYLVLLLAIGAIDYYCAQGIVRTSRPAIRRAFLAASIVSNLAILGYFKYAGFFLGELQGLLGEGRAAHPALDVILPAGISFYTFKSMSYTIDVYRSHLLPVGTRLDYLTFVSFFPDLIAGPIVRASVFLPQMGRPIGPTPAGLRDGASLFLLGLGKKLLIADHVAVVADTVFATPGAWSCGTAWLGLLAYSLQIYCDFSGYSDMAIGTARMLGYQLPENFDMPYLARSVTEFWRRWHITLSEWLRDYLYIPLGGNRRGPVRTQINLMITMLLGGLWHGASWNFVLWGFLHGLALAVHRAWKQTARVSLPAPLAWLVTFVFVILCWVPFRAPDFPSTLELARSLAGLGDGRQQWTPLVVVVSLALAIAGHIVGVQMAAGRNPLRWLGTRLCTDSLAGRYLTISPGTVAGGFLFVSAVLAIYLFGAVGTSPFIYFQF